MTLRILILGVNGFIGNSLTEHILQSKGWEVYGMDMAADKLDQCLGHERFHYVEGDIVPKDPFQVIDFDGVGGLMQLGVERGRKTRSDLKIGICGEHGGEPDSVKFCHKVGLNYVSCSPFRVPIARLAAAQAALGK